MGRKAVVSYSGPPEGQGHSDHTGAAEWVGDRQREQG